MKLRDLHNLYRLENVGIPVGNGFFKGVIIGGAISLIIWAVILKLIF